jgi:pilus assembly protein CpaE
MRLNLLLISGDPQLGERLQQAVAEDCVVMTIDLRTESVDAIITRFVPTGIVIDASTHAGTRTVLEHITSLRSQFAHLPLVAIGDEMSAQLILTAFRAGIDDFLDRDASDSQIRNTILTLLREKGTKTASDTAALISVMSPTPCEEDSDLALNIACLIATDVSKRVLLLDMSLPSSPARTALGLELSFTINAAIRDMPRLDSTFLDSALSRDARTGLWVLPLAGEFGQSTPPDSHQLAVLLQILKSLFDTIVISWGPFSRQATEAGIATHNLVCCNQRFSSVRNAKSFLTELQIKAPALDAVLVIHQLDGDLVPSADNIVEATAAKTSLTLRSSWEAMALAHNRGQPLSLSAPSPYTDALRTYLAENGLTAAFAANNPTLKLLHWLRAGA